MAIVTKIWVKITPVPPMQKTLLAIYPDIESASNGVSAIVGQGILPAAIEMLDKISIQAIEAASHAGYPLDAGAVLLLEVDGVEPVVREGGRDPGPGLVGLEDLVDKEEWRPMRNERLDHVPAERWCRNGHAALSSSRSLSRARPRCAWHFAVPTGMPAAEAISSNE